jgi:predicted O-methyltransferase YrrM
MRKFLNRLAAYLTISLNQRLLDLREAFDNESTVINLRLSELRQAFDNQSTAINRRLDRITAPDRPTEPFVKPEPLRPLFETGADSIADTLACIDLVERYSHDWAANAASYQRNFGELRRAARRLLHTLQGPLRDARVLSDAAIERVRHIEDQIACLARQPLFFPEMFHGVQLQPDGRFEPLAASEFEHIRAGGLLGLEDRPVIGEIYWKLFQTCTGPLRVVEIGSAAGRGSTRIGGEYVRRTGGTLYCIDPHNAQGRGGTYLAFLANLRIFELESTVLPVRANSVEAAGLFDDGSLDAVFVDGSHIYEDVLADIEAYLPKIRQGGLIFGHDLHDVPSRFNRAELLKVADQNNAEVTYTNLDGRIERVNVHPGVILAVQDRFGDDIETFSGSVVWARQV